MAKTFKFKSDEEIVKKASDIFEKLGLSLDQAVSIFLRQSILQNGIPFRLVLPDGQNEIPEGVKQDKPAEKSEKAEKESPLFEQMKASLSDGKSGETAADETKKAIADLRSKLKARSESAAVSDDGFASKIKESVQALQKKLSDKANEPIAEEQSNEQIRESLSKLKSRLSERFTNEQEEDQSKSEEKLSKIEEQISKDFSETEADSSKIKESLEKIKSRLSENFDKKEGSDAEETESAEKIRDSLSALKSRISETFAKPEKKEEDASEIKNSVAELKSKLSETFSKAENAGAGSEESIPTVSDIVNENSVPAKTEPAESPNEEDEDETAPDSMFDKWGQDDGAAASK